MTEHLQTILVDVFMGIFTILAGWIGCTLSGIREDLKAKVEKEDCQLDMGRHCTRLDKLEEHVSQNQAAIAVLKARVEG